MTMGKRLGKSVHIYLQTAEPFFLQFREMAGAAYMRAVSAEGDPDAAEPIALDAMAEDALDLFRDTTGCGSCESGIGVQVADFLLQVMGVEGCRTLCKPFIDTAKAEYLDEFGQDHRLPDMQSEDPGD